MYGSSFESLTRGRQHAQAVFRIHAICGLRVEETLNPKPIFDPESLGSGFVFCFAVWVCFHCE